MLTWLNESEETYRPRRVLTPILLSREVVDEHNILGHCQYRSWSPHYVAGRGVGRRHVSVEEQPGSLPIVMFHNACIGGRGMGRETELARQAMGSYQRVMEEGQCLGDHARNGSILVMTDQNVLQESGARRTPEEMRWSMARAHMISLGRSSD